MIEKNEATAAPEHNKTGQDFTDHSHFRYSGSPLIDVHAHVFQTRPSDPKDGPPSTGPGATAEQAEVMLQVAKDFHIGRIYSMCPADDMPVLRERFGDQLGFNGSIAKKLDEPDDVAYRLLERYLEQGVSMLKLWSAPRGRERGLVVDAPWRIEAVRRAQAAGIRIIMVHVADPDLWFRKVYTDAVKFGTKEDQYRPFERMMQLFPDLIWIGAHMGGDPEHADHLQSLLERYPNLHFDTSAAKWQIREVSAHRDSIRSLMCKMPERFLFGSDLVTRHGLPKEHYASRYWSHRTLWESNWEGFSPIADPDYESGDAEQKQPPLRGLALPNDVLSKVYYENAKRLLG